MDFTSGTRIAVERPEKEDPRVERANAICLALLLLGLTLAMADHLDETVVDVAKYAVIVFFLGFVAKMCVEDVYRRNFFEVIFMVVIITVSAFLGDSSSGNNKNNDDDDGDSSGGGGTSTTSTFLYGFVVGIAVAILAYILGCYLISMARMLWCIAHGRWGTVATADGRNGRDRDVSPAPSVV